MKRQWKGFVVGILFSTIIIVAGLFSGFIASAPKSTEYLIARERELYANQRAATIKEETLQTEKRALLLEKENGILRTAIDSGDVSP